MIKLADYFAKAHCLLASINHFMFTYLQTGQETDFVLVSCTGLGIEPSRREQVLKAKRVSPFRFSYFCVEFYCQTC